MSKPYSWIASLYFFQSLPFVTVSLISGLIFNQSGMNNASVSSLVSFLILPWVLKPIFAPCLEVYTNKKRLTVFIQMILTFLFLIIGLSMNQGLLLLILLFVLLAFMSCLHDILSDGIYILTLNKEHQKCYIALRTVFYQLGRLVLKGALLTLSGQFAHRLGLSVWQTFFFLLFLICLALTIYHHFKIPSRKKEAHRDPTNYLHILKQLLSKPKFLTALSFIFLFNISDAQIQRMLPLFLVDSAGAHLSLSEIGTAYGMIGGLSLIAGVILSKPLVFHWSLTTLLRMASLFLLAGPLSLLISISDLQAMLYLSIVVTQFMSGLANGIFMSYILSIANKTTHPMSAYSLCTSVMAISILIFGAISGIIEQSLGYFNFFVYTFCINMILVFVTHRTGEKNV
jgi:PAT family beta-lactamase induction signal transducer AmpG